jgi:hypothetical protein
MFMKEGVYKQFLRFAFSHRGLMVVMGAGAH